MTIDTLPAVSTQPALTFHHFPTRHQAVIWRNWGLVPTMRLAALLGATEAQVFRCAAELGLPAPVTVSRRWLDRSYITLIRNNWHLLPYRQLLLLLDWTAARLDFVLREEDFLWYKLGSLKPACDEVRYRELTPEEQAATERVKQTVRTYFPTLPAEFASYVPFDFLDRWEIAEPRHSEPPSTNRRRDPFEIKFLYSYSAGYGDALLGQTADPYPESLLREYARHGINGIWLQAILYTLHPLEKAPAFSTGAAERIANLRALVSKAGRHGIGVYLYLNEPRQMPAEFFEAYPDWRGVQSQAPGEEHLYAMCTSSPGVRAYLEEACQQIFTQVPGLAGVFTITMSENLSNCHSRNYGAGCPRCGTRPPPEIVAEVNTAIARGVHRAAPAAKVIAYTWAWAKEWQLQAIDLLPEKIDVMCVSEWGLPIAVGGVKGEVIDYSISCPGPSAASRACWDRARRNGLKAVAKVQLNCSWECATLPYLPVPYLVKEHLDNLTQAGVSGLMLSWTLGGYPGGNFALLSSTPEELALEKFGTETAPAVCAAWKQFSNAFREFPFHLEVLYLGPQNLGPANLLFDRPTGYRATMTGFPYDDIDAWRATYPPLVFEEQLRRLSEEWQTGLRLLPGIEEDTPAVTAANLRELTAVATAAWCHFKSSHLQFKFNRLRNAADPAAAPELQAILDAEIVIAVTLYNLAKKDTRIGFEASNHYLYTPNDLVEKVLSCAVQSKVRR
jgi:hypothetical protein